MRLADSHIVITGASRGIGESLAREVAGCGARVTVLARSAGRLKDLADELGGLAVPVDLCAADELDSIIERIEAQAGPIASP
jgi:NADP-dependent 3-hydroxy acid dehydrogenase YdfG